MMSWTLAGRNRFFLIFVSFDQAKEKRKRSKEPLLASPKGRNSIPM
jgi:hypothetical protein